MELITRLRAALAIPEAAPDDALLGAVQDLRQLPAELRGLFGLADDADPVAHARQLAADLPALRRQAEDGRAYRDALTAEALAEAVRAFGAEAEERQAPVLRALDLNGVRQMRDAWREIGDARLPGGRVTVDGGEPKAPKAPAPVEQPDVYRAG